MGSVTSKRYSKIWRDEIKKNSNRFKIFIISTHKTRMEATIKETEMQCNLNVVNNPLYVNMGIFKNSHVNTYGIPTTLGMKFSRETRKKQSEARLGKRHTIDTKIKISLSNKGKKVSEATRHKMSESQKARPPRTEEQKQNHIRSRPRGETHPKFGHPTPEHVKYASKLANTKYYYLITDSHGVVERVDDLMEWVTQQGFSHLKSACINLRQGKYKGFSCVKIPIT